MGRAPSAPRPDSSVLVEIGDRSFSGRVETADYQPGRRRLILRVSAPELASAAPDYADAARVWVYPRTDQERIFGLAGNVMRASPSDGDDWRVEISELGAIQDITVGGIGVRNCQPPEIFWAMVRDVGLPAARVNMSGWRPPTEKFLVVVPVEGVDPVADLETAGIGLTRDPDVPSRFVGLGPDELHAAFAEPGLWAITVVSGSRMWDVEQEAVGHFERLLGRLTLAARYTMATGPDGTLREYDIARSRGEARLRPIAGVQAAETGRIWLRGYATAATNHPVDPHVIDGLASLIGAPSERIDEAISAWRRASKEEDSAAAAVALSEALEFYAAGAQVDPLFSKADLRKMTRAAALALGETTTKERRDRVALRIGQMNDPPSTLLLRAALVGDGVACSTKEFELLRRVRDVRRKVLHGERREVLSRDDVRLALALVNRFLMFRLRRIRSEQRPSRIQDARCRDS